MYMYNVEELIAMAAEKRASDVHLIAGLPPKCRIDGEIVNLADVPLSKEDCDTYGLELAGEHIKKIDSIGQLDFAATLAGRRIRVNLFRQQGAISAALRLLSNRIPKLDELGLPQAVRQFPKWNKGIILVTGETGSGKSTTLAAILDEINQTRPLHIITLEDPIEYLHSHEKSIVNQREVGIDTQSYAGALRAALREDPDIILVGEMRDLDTIATAVTAAETGHLVLSTLHTIGAVPTIERIIDVFPMNQQAQIRLQLATLLEAIISQQLLPTADRNGRVAAFEIMYANSAVRNLIREAKPHQIPSIIQTNKQSGMMMMDDALYELYRTHQITAEDAMTFAQDPSNLARRIPAGKMPTPLAEPSWQMDDWDGPTFGSGGF